MKCWFWHNWDIWKSCRVIITPKLGKIPILSMQYTVEGQSRVCKKCGKEQTRKV